MKYVPGEKFQPPPQAGRWANEYFCSSCGWRAKLDVDPRRCPKCRRVIQREMTTLDRMIASPSRVVAGLFVAGVAGWLLWTLASTFSVVELINFGGKTEIVAHLKCTKLSKSDEGYTATFRLENPSPRDLEEVVVYLNVGGLQATPKPDAPESSVVVPEGAQSQEGGNAEESTPTEVKLEFGPISAEATGEAEVVIPSAGSGTPETWTARVGSFELPRKFQNTARQILATLTLEGDLERTPTLFPALSVSKPPAKKEAKDPASGGAAGSDQRVGDPPAGESPNDKTPSEKSPPDKPVTAPTPTETAVDQPGVSGSGTSPESGS